MEEKELGGICPKCKIFIYARICPICKSEIKPAKIGILMEKDENKN